MFIEATIKATATLSESEAKQVSALVEDLPRTPEWHPFVRKVTIKKSEKKARGMVLEWTGMLAGLPVGGSSEVLEWKPGREYVWFSKDLHIGLSIKSGFVFESSGKDVLLTALVAFSLPKELAPLSNQSAVNEFLGRNLERALERIKTVASSEGR